MYGANRHGSKEQGVAYVFILFNFFIVVVINYVLLMVIANIYGDNCLRAYTLDLMIKHANGDLWLSSIV